MAEQSVSKTAETLLQLPYELLVLACQFVENAHALAPGLAIRPPALPPSDFGAVLSSNSETSLQADLSRLDKMDDYLRNAEALYSLDPKTLPERRRIMADLGDMLASYRRYIAAAIICLRKVIAIDDIDGSPVIRLRAIAMLAELLINETEEAAEAEMLLSRGISASSQHISLVEYRLRFQYMQVSLAISRGNTKFARSSLKRYIADYSPAHNISATWQYRFLLLNISLALDHEKSMVTALTAAQDLLDFATFRDDQPMQWLANLYVARVAMIAEDITLSRQRLRWLAKTFNKPSLLPAEPSSHYDGIDATDTFTPADLEVVSDLGLPRSLVMQFLVILCAYNAAIGKMNAAKLAVRQIQNLADASDAEDGHIEGYVYLPVKANPNQKRVNVKLENVSEDLVLSSERIVLKILPKRVFYLYTYLISTAINFDPSAIGLRSLLFSAAGIDLLDASIVGDDPHASSTHGNLRSIITLQEQLAHIRVDILLYRATMLVMRSQLWEARATLDDCIVTARCSGLWPAVAGRIALVQGTIAHCLLDLDRAQRCYFVALQNFDPTSFFGIVCRASTLLVMIARDVGNSDPTHINVNLANLAQSVVIDCSSKSDPTMELLALVVEGLTSGELTKSKACFTSALALADSLQVQHLKPLLLCFLGAYFHHTDASEAAKMMRSSYAISKSMGGIDGTHRGPHGPEIVGVIHLGLYALNSMLENMHRLDESEHRIQRYEGHKKAHQFRLEQEQSWAKSSVHQT